MKTNTTTEKEGTLDKNFFTIITSSYKKQSKRNKILFLIILVGILFFLFSLFFNKKKVVEEKVEGVRKVEVVSVSKLRDNEKDFPLTGNVTSRSEATIRSESGGRLTQVYKKLGDYVAAGSIIAQFENSAERASLLQAEGSYEQAKAASGIVSLNNKQAGYSLGDAKTQALNTITSTYNQMDDAVRGKTDGAYSSPKLSTIKFLPSVPDSILISSLEAKRKNLETLLTNREEQNKTLTSASDLISEIATIEKETLSIKAYLDDLFTAYTKAIPDSYTNQTSIDGGKANTQAARQSISSVLSSLSGARASLTSSQTANQVAGGQNSEISGSRATADAQVKQALGSYNAALSRLEKTVIRSPIPGTLNSLSITTGDYVGAFTQVAVVSNNGALEILSSITEDDTKRVVVGSQVLIENTIKGIVTRVAQAIDPTTKKIEVRIAIIDNTISLVNGQAVRISIIAPKKTTTTTVRSGPIVIPLSALKLTPRGANVFRVSASSTLIAIPVKEGAVLGEEIQILEGLKGSEDIVLDARGLKEGQTITLE